MSVQPPTLILTSSLKQLKRSQPLARIQPFYCMEEPCSKKCYLHTTNHKNTSTTSAKTSTTGLAPTPSEAAPGKGATPDFVGFIVLLLSALTTLKAPWDKAVIVDVGVIVRRDVSVWAAAAEDDIFIELAIADIAETGGMLKRPTSTSPKGCEE